MEYTAHLYTSDEEFRWAKVEILHRNPSGYKNRSMEYTAHLYTSDEEFRWAKRRYFTEARVDTKIEVWNKMPTFTLLTKSFGGRIGDSSPKPKWIQKIGVWNKLPTFTLLTKSFGGRRWSRRGQSVKN